ncbi:hypothetical protein [Tenacibaculum agarivorans]|uniref:hypothetical protein n=1 Tax=Tenacibaculum agarivorans TaxID=1908389 RepID=UPI00094B8008|nr:hypothetical protein [Tenacibaculum agarivorans]
MNSILKNKSTVLLFVVIAVLYLCFPTQNSSLDAYAYAGYVKHNFFLFTPHHLFSNVLIYALSKALEYLGFYVDVLWLGKITNSVFQLLNLVVLYKILSYLKVDKVSKNMYVAIVAFSFSLWRYGTENETYIVPITFSLLGSFQFLLYQLKLRDRYLLLSSFFGVIACLFHQIHFFGWLGLGVGCYQYTKKFKTLLLYILPAFLVPLSYILVVVFYENQDLNFNNLSHFVFHDFYKGTVQTDFGWKGFFFQALNTIRTYIQIHPNIYYLIQRNWLYAVPFMICVLIIFTLIKRAFKKENVFIKREHSLSLFLKIHLYIFITNYLFAFYNYGNVEFMVMLPFLLVLFVVIQYKVDITFLKRVALFLCIWNFCFAILPNRIYSYYNDTALVDYMALHPKSLFIIKNHEAKNQYYYKTGINDASNILLYRKLTSEKLIQLLKDEKEVYTDVLGKPEILNKEKITASNLTVNFEEFKKEEVFSYEGFYGTSKLYKISLEK